MKYRPEYPSKAFENLARAQLWVDEFVCWYNTCHLHSTIHFVTPDDRHYGLEQQILKDRKGVYENARHRHPERWSRKTRNWNPVTRVYLNPKKHQVEPMQPLKNAA
jgi:hypothetical protein